MNPLAAEDAVAVALAFYQAPARHHDLLHGHAPLPAGVDRLLRLAGGAAPGEAGAAPHPDELAAAARFFVEQVLLAHDADHYRLLGVNRDADLEQIKEHHRLLMRMFHPDRDNGIEPEVKAAHASRINLAYNALRQAGNRSAYDTQLRQARKPAMAAPAARAAYRRMAPQPAGLAPRMPPVVARNLPQFVLGGIALIAVVAVAAVYLDRPPEGAIGWEAGDRAARAAAPEPGPRLAAAQSPATALPAPPATSTHPAAAREAPPALAPASPVAVKPALAAPLAPKPALAAPPKPAPATSTAQPAPAPPTRLAQAERNRTEAAAQSAPASAPVAPAAAPPAEAVAAAAVAAPQPAPAPPAGLSETDLAKLVARFSERYASGDLESFMALFDDAARSEAGGKGQIRSDYENLFRNSQQRSIVIWGMDWRQSGDQARGEGSFQARVLRSGESAPRTYTGKISIEAVWRGNTALIRSFNHAVKR